MTAQHDDPRIGPYNAPVPPPSPNGSRVERASPFDPLRRAAPGFVAGLIMSLSSVPSQALFGTAHFTQWWHLAVAAGTGGLVTGAWQRRSGGSSAALGAAVGMAGLLLAYAVVRGKLEGSHGAARVLADTARLSAWGIVAGAACAFAGFGARKLVESRARSRPKTATPPH